MSDSWQDNYFKREAMWRAKTNKFPFQQMPVSLGVEKGKLDIEWWSHNMKDEKKKKEFQETAMKLIQSTARKAKTGLEVARGVDIEHLYYKIEHGYTDEQYAKHLQSYD